MFKKTIALLLAVTMLLMVGCKRRQKPNPPLSQPTQTQTHETGSDVAAETKPEAVPEEKPMDVQLPEIEEEVDLSGLEDSEFDDSIEEEPQTADEAPESPANVETDGENPADEKNPEEQAPETPDEVPENDQPEQQVPTEPEVPEQKPDSGSNDRPVVPEVPEQNEPEQNIPDEPAQGGTDSSGMDYSEFMNLSPSEQQAVMDSFESMDAFFDWYSSEKDRFETENPPIDVGNGEVDLDEIFGN